MLVLVMGFSAQPGKADVFSYVVNRSDNTVSVIDTAYVTNGGDGSVSATVTSKNTVVATIKVGFESFGVAFAPDGRKLYVTNLPVPTSLNGAVSMIDTAVISPDGKEAYLANLASSNVSLATASNTVVATRSPCPEISGVRRL